jgi:hypothetical protein
LCKIHGFQIVKMAWIFFKKTHMCMCVSVFYLWCFDLKYIWFTFSLNVCNYCNVICIKFYNVCALNMNIHVFHSKTMFDMFEYLRYWICTNIIYINHGWNSCNFCMKLWKPYFAQNLYKPMKSSNFVMLLIFE